MENNFDISLGNNDDINTQNFPFNSEESIANNNNIDDLIENMQKANHDTTHSNDEEIKNNDGHTYDYNSYNIFSSVAPSLSFEKKRSFDTDLIFSKNPNDNTERDIVNNDIINGFSNKETQEDWTELSMKRNEINSFSSEKSALTATGGEKKKDEKCVEYKNWQEKHRNKLKNIEENEKREIEQIREDARAQISAFYERRRAKISENMKINREKQKMKINKQVFISSNQANGITEELSKEESWGKVLNIIDFTKNSNQRDTCRFKEILLSLTTKN